MTYNSDEYWRLYKEAEKEGARLNSNVIYSENDLEILRNRARREREEREYEEYLDLFNYDNEPRLTFTRRFWW